MHLREKYGQTALVAGASEGIGATFSSFLAASGMDLVLIARRREPLEKLAALLIGKYNIDINIICCDLSEKNAVQFIKDATGDKEIDMLIYNAALSHIGHFENDDIEHIIQIANANMNTPMMLVRMFGESMLHRQRGAVILMSSLAGFQGSGFVAAYAATKAFNKVLAEGLWYEWKNRGVDVIACCAGATASENYIRTNPERSDFFEPKVQSPEEVVRDCFRQLGKNPSFVSGRGNRLANFVMQRLLSRKTAVRIISEATRKRYRL